MAFGLRFLGTARIDGPDGRLTGKPAQRHRLALLAVLATARDGSVPRERLMALLWPEQDTSRARHLLNESVHVLRKALGEHALTTAGDDLCLNHDVLPSDVVRFRHARQAGDLPAARAAYGGPFLDGFYLDGVADFAHWQDEERAKLATEFEATLTAIAEAAERGGAWDEAAAAWAQLADVALVGAPVTLRHMRAAHAAGDRDAALRAADRYAARCANELEVAPNAEVLQLAARIRAEPVTATSLVPAQPAAVPGEIAVAPVRSAAARPSDAPAVRQPRQSRRVTALVSVGVLALIAITWALGRWTNAPSPDFVTTANAGTLPRRTKNEAAYHLFVQGRQQWNLRTRDGIRSALESFQEAVRLDPNYAEAWAGLADAWSLMPDYGNMPTTTGLSNARAAALRAIALDSNLASAHASLGLQLEGREHDLPAAEASFRRALRLNADYASARQWLGINLASQGRFDEAVREIEQARRSDPQSRIIQTAVGSVRYFARDWSGSIAEYRLVINQSPEFALGWALLGRALLLDAQVAEAVEALRYSVELSDGDPSHRAVYAATLAAAGRTVEARQQAEQVLAVPDRAYVPYCELAAAYLYLGDVDRAMALFEQAVARGDNVLKHMKVEPLYDRARGDARFTSILTRLQLDGR